MAVSACPHPAATVGAAVTSWWGLSLSPACGFLICGIFLSLSICLSYEASLSVLSVGGPHSMGHPCLSLLPCKGGPGLGSLLVALTPRPPLWLHLPACLAGTSGFLYQQQRLQTPLLLTTPYACAFL